MLGIIWLSLSGQAQIDHTVFDPPVVISIPDSCGSTKYDLDLNNDSSYDFYLEVELFNTIETSPRLIRSHRSNIFGYGSNKINPGPFTAGDPISSSLNYLEWSAFYGWVPEYGGFIGNWAIQKIKPENSAYIGLKLEKNGLYYYGWIELKTDGRFIEILSYAVETSASVPIDAGQY
jgi:hypothetical protein